MEENLFTFEKSEQVSNEYISNLNVSKNEQQQNAIETNSVSETPKQEDDVVDFQTIQNLGELDRESVIQKINTTTDEKERNELTILIISVITAVLSHCFTDITYFWIQTGAFYAILLGSIGCEERRLGIESELILKSRIF